MSKNSQKFSENGFDEASFKPIYAVTNPQQALSFLISANNKENQIAVNALKINLADFLSIKPELLIKISDQFAFFLKKTEKLSVLSLKHLKTAHLHFFRADQYFKKFLDAISRNQSIKKLSLELKDLKQNVDEICKIIEKNNSLEILEIKFDQCSKEDLQKICASLEKNKKIKKFIFTQNESSTIVDLEPLIDLIRKTDSLNSLDLYGCNSSILDLAKLCEACFEKPFKEFSLGKNFYSKDKKLYKKDVKLFFENLEKIALNPALKSLKLIDFASLNQIADHQTTLKKFFDHLQEKIGDLDAKFVFDSIFAKQINEAYLEDKIKLCINLDNEEDIATEPESEEESQAVSPDKDRFDEDELKPATKIAKPETCVTLVSRKTNLKK